MTYQSGVCDLDHWATASTSGTLNNRQTARPLVKLVEVEERLETPDHFQGTLPQDWAGTKINRTVPSVVFKTMANARCTIRTLPR
ncbi:hypothetical protein TNCV_840871 [Trichonephila clavipes]|nr:hypothetical protein TNCV_840871 [Trichonephila clavipes]